MERKLSNLALYFALFLKIKLPIPPLVLLLAYFAIPGARLCLGQQIVWANKNNLDRRTDFTKVIGQNRFGTYVLKHKNSSFRKYFILEHFDRRMNLLKTKVFKIPGAELEKIIVHRNGILFFTKHYEKGDVRRITVQSIDSGMNESLPKTVAQFSGQESVSAFRVEFNPDKSLFMLWYLKENEGKTTLAYHLMDRNITLKDNAVSLPFALKDVYVGDGLLDDSGNLYALLTHSEKFRSKEANDFRHHLLALNPGESQVRYILLNEASQFVNSYKLNFNPESGYVAACLLTGIADEDENKGWDITLISCTDFSVLKRVSEDFDRKTVAKIIGIKAEQKGETLSKFKIRKLIPKTDGGMLLVCERMFITTQSDIFYVNGIPQSSYARIFNNDEVLLMNFDSSLNILWTDVIVKNQSSVNDGGYYNGIVVMVNDNSISILYNDRLNANADIIQVSYADDGSHSKKILLNNDQYYALLIPSEYSQVSANSIVIPVNQNREFTYIKLLY